MTHQNNAKYLRHRSHLALEMAARACLGAAGVSARAVWACFGVAQGAQNGRSKPPVQPLGSRNGHLGLPRFWWSAHQAVWACFGVARALKTATQSRQCARRGCFRVLTNCWLPACPVGLPGCHLHLPACHWGTL